EEPHWKQKTPLQCLLPPRVPARRYRHFAVFVERPGAAYRRASGAFDGAEYALYHVVAGDFLCFGFVGGQHPVAEHVRRDGLHVVRRYIRTPPKERMRS